MKKHYFGALALLLCSVISLVSCTDERFYVDDEEIGDGVASISAEALFKNFTPALSRGVAGTALDGIRNLSIFVYNADESELVCTTSFSKDDGDLNVTDNSMTPPDGSYDPTGSANLTTSKADFSFSLPYGRYRIYAVANVGEADKAKLSADKVKTGADLKNVRFDWSGNIKEDGQMFGVFTTDELAKSPASTFDAPEVVIKKSDVKLGAWLRRLASKVTVAYDPSGLKEAVTIYIKSATLHHIPKECTLGESNTPKSLEELTTGSSISYVTSGTDASNHSNWLKLQKGSGSKGSTGHLHGDESLFFYENNQGDYAGKGKEYCKVQNADEMGENTFYPDQTTPGGSDKYVDWKDKVPYGTFIEVEAYYLSQNKEKPSSGPIKYRFMLGKDVTYNYDAERNYHFKLTLKFNNWANEPDWHVDYDEPTPSMYVPEHYYISYLYNQEMKMPLRIVMNNDLSSNYVLKSEIIENNWAPYDPTTKNNVPEQWIGNWNVFNGFAWNAPAYNSTTNAYRKGMNFVGFLSMRKTLQPILYADKDYRDTDAASTLRAYYDNNKRAFGEYPLTPGVDLPVSNSADNGTYDVIQNADKSLTLHIPMFTRAKEMIPSTDFTANNPYDSYMRKAVVRFTIWDLRTNQKITFKDDDGKDIDYKDVPIFQVRRIVNPKAIWRKSSSTESFHVKLMRLVDADETNFTTFESEGAWRATILVDPNGLIKLSKDGKEVTGVGNHVDGSTGSIIDFSYQPTSAIGAKETRCGIIQVEYHDYTCKHLIFVRQGYDAPVALGGKEWSCYSAYATSLYGTGGNPATPSSINVAVTKSPLSIGSFFKRNNYNYAIREANNSKYGWLSSVTGTDDNISTAYVDDSKKVINRNAKWGDFGGYAWTSYTGNDSRFDYSWAATWTPVNNANIGRNLAVPTYDDYVALRDQNDFGYGVVYGDGASEMQTTMAQSYGYTDYDNLGTESPMGIRACVIYNKSNGNQIIFPLGSIGQGRRARSSTAIGSTGNSFDNPGAGALTYSGILSPLYGDGNMNRPITYNLYRNPGAIYWFKQPAYKPQTSVNNTLSKRRVASWDINYFTLVFNPYDSGSLGTSDNGNLNFSTSTDALPIRLIYK